MTEHAANYGRACLWLCSPGGRRRFWLPAPTSPRTHGSGLLARLEGWTDRHVYIC